MATSQVDAQGTEVTENQSTPEPKTDDLMVEASAESATEEAKIKEEASSVDGKSAAEAPPAPNGVEDPQEADMKTEETAAPKVEEPISDSKIEETVRHVLKDQDLETTTMRQVRAKVEQELQLPAGALDSKKEKIKSVAEQVMAEAEGAPAAADGGDDDGFNPGDFEDSDDGVRRSSRGGGHAVSKKKRKATKASGRKGGFQKPRYLSAELAAVCGSDRMGRTDVTRKLWAYIKENKRQDPKNGQFIISDDLLFPIFKTKRIQMMKMTRLVNNHIKEAVTESEDEEEADQAAASGDDSDESEPKKRPAKKARPAAAAKSGKSGGGFAKPIKLSEELASLVGEPEMGRGQVTKQLWVYIKENNLQNPQDKKQIICDERLQQLFGVDKVDMFGMNRLLKPHFLG